jgi:hypothetical protein
VLVTLVSSFRIERGIARDAGINHRVGWDAQGQESIIPAIPQGKFFRRFPGCAGLKPRIGSKQKVQNSN